MILSRKAMMDLQMEVERLRKECAAKDAEIEGLRNPPKKDPPVIRAAEIERLRPKPVKRVVKKVRKKK